MGLVSFVFFCFVTTTRIFAQDQNICSRLILTPYIESGNFAQGRRLARVPFTDQLGIKSYSGFFTVNKRYNSNMFFWYFPVMNTSKNAPVLLWLNGGPGSSSLIGAFVQNGPIKISNGKFERRLYHWARNHHIFYIDNPVGTGFSFTDSKEGYCTDINQVGRDLYSAVYQFFQLFPELQNNKFFITGESYAGKYVPALAYTIHKSNPKGALKINLEGIALGNAICDPINQVVVYSSYLYQIGLLDDRQAHAFASYENKIVDLIKKKRWSKAHEIFDNLLLGGKNNSIPTVFRNFTGFDGYYNLLVARDRSNFSQEIRDMLAQKYVQEGFHVCDSLFNDGTMVRNLLIGDFMQTVAPWLSELIDNYRVLIYSGQLDLLLSYVSSENYLKKLNFTANPEYLNANRHIWTVDGDVAGYMKRAKNLVTVLIRNSGHMVPTEQPKWALKMMTQFTEDCWE